ncbi:MAG: leucine-rich repeat domain-containing protein, partial [Bacteroidota bacterium]
LQSLYLSSNQISDISFLQHLHQLQSLYLSSNQISDISFLQHLHQLQSLYLSSNQISNISFLQHLHQLQSLYLSSNQISDISFLQHFRQLQYLDLSENQIADIKILKKLKNIHELTLYNNPIKNIPNALLGDNKYSNCYSDVVAWWKATADPKAIQPNYLFKMLVTGNGNVGKSSIVTALKESKCSTPHDSTHGIQLEKWTNKLSDPQVAYNIWDFGGQEIYHGTHQMFIRSEAIQLIVFDPETEERAEEQQYHPDRITEEAVRDSPLHFWIHQVKEQSPKSKIIIVQNKKGIFPKVSKQHKMIATELEVDDFVHTDALAGTGIGILKSMILERTQELREYGMLMPQSWLAVRAKLTSNLETSEEPMPPLMSKAAFEELCQAHRVMEKTVPALLKLLHHSGILYYNEEYLKDTIIIDQRWALNAIYRPMDRGSDFYDNIRKDWKGNVRAKHIFEAFGDGYTPAHKWLFLQFMQSCGLCFPIKYEGREDEKNLDNRYIFPEFLPPTISAEAELLWAKRSDPKQYYQKEYDYVDYYKIQSFIARLGRKTELKYIWRNGILIPTAEGLFMVELVAHPEERLQAMLITIEKSAERKWLLEIIRELEGYAEANTLENWKTSTNNQDYQPLEKNQLPSLAEKITHRRKEDAPTTPPKETLMEKLPEVIQDTAPRKKLELFLASSNELKMDRDAIERWVRRQNDRLYDKNIYLKLNLWEDFLDAMSKTRLQDEYNKAVAKSNIFIGLFGTKVGKYTREEFKIAHQNFQERNKPKYVYTYFKEVSYGGTEEDLKKLKSLVNFKKYVGRLGHFYTLYKSTEDLERQLREQLDKILKMEGME